MHGTDCNPLVVVADKVKSTFVSDISCTQYYNRHGTVLDAEACQLMERKAWGYFKEASEYSREHYVESRQK